MARALGGVAGCPRCAARQRYHRPSPTERTAMPTLEFFFDVSSPWTYLAFENIQPIAHRHGVAIDWRPFLVGGVFNTVNPTVYAGRENPPPAPKRAYYAKDLQDWARYTGIRIGAPPVFPVNSVKAMRGAFLALERDLLVPYARAMFDAYWGELRDISQDDVLADVVARVGIAPQAFFEYIAADACKARLRASTEELMARGGFGSPTIFLDRTEMFFGNDRLPLVQHWLEQATRA
jgi:2-hydroxychromene-2-carboxylate isomerase